MYINWIWLALPSVVLLLATVVTLWATKKLPSKITTKEELY